VEHLESGFDGSDMRDVCNPIMATNGPVILGYVNWLQGVRWQLFCTFTFAWPVSDPQADKVFKRFIDRLEKSLACPIAYIRGDEKRFSGCGMPAAPRHFHAVLTTHGRLDRHWVADHWMQMAGHRLKGAGADVRIYDPNLGGLAYVLKFINQPNGEWAVHNLDLFLRTLDTEQMTSRERRRRSRHTRRVLQANAVR
jgi:hypothetical protein